MALAVKTVEFPFETRITTLATATTLASATEHDFADVTVPLPESSKTIRAAWVELTVRDQTTTTGSSLDGVRIGVQIDAVAFDDGTDLTGTGIANTGDQYSFFVSRDLTSYFTTNYTGTSHAVGIRVRFEQSAASIVGNITCKLYVTYQYEDTSSRHVKTVKIPLEGITGSLNTTANTNIRGSAGAAQIPALDTFLPETNKTYRKIWFEVEANDRGAAATDFNALYAIDSGSNARATLEQALNTSVRYDDIWVQDSMTTNVTHDFQAWSSLVNMFEGFNVVCCVTYEFDESSTTIMNSVRIPFSLKQAFMSATIAADQDVIDVPFWIEEPATITMRQSAVKVVFDYYQAGNMTISVQGVGASGGSQGTTSSLYTGTATMQAGTVSKMHRIDLAHGGTAVTVARGLNIFRIKMFCSAVTTINSVGGYIYLNYTSGKSSQGIGAHNVTTQWPICTHYDGTIAGATNREVATTNQKTPNIPQTNYLLNSSCIEANYMSSALVGYYDIYAELVSGEGPADGWLTDPRIFLRDGEYNHATVIYEDAIRFRRWSNSASACHGPMDIETARKYRIIASNASSSLKRVITTHSITFSVSGTVSGSSGGTVNIGVFDVSSGERLKTGSRVGNGSYTITVHDNTREVFGESRESGTLLGRTDNGLATGNA